jgi:hypothetical protein
MHEFDGNKIEFVRRALVRRLWALLYGSVSPLVTDATTQLTTPMLSSSPLDQVKLHTTNGGHGNTVQHELPLFRSPKIKVKESPKVKQQLCRFWYKTHRDMEALSCVCVCVKAMHEPQTGALYFAHSH